MPRIDDATAKAESLAGVLAHELVEQGGVDDATQLAAIAMADHLARELRLIRALSA